MRIPPGTRIAVIGSMSPEVAAQLQTAISTLSLGSEQVIVVDSIPDMNDRTTQWMEVPPDISVRPVVAHHEEKKSWKQRQRELPRFWRK